PQQQQHQWNVQLQADLLQVGAALSLEDSLSEHILRPWDRHEPFIVGIYLGPSEPPSVLEFLLDCINEGHHLLPDGLRSTPNRILQYSLRSVTCDTSARCFVRQCTQEGVQVARRPTFSSSHSPLRTREMFQRQSNAAHRFEDSRFCGIPSDVVSTFSSDYMHLVCLRVMKRMSNLWLFSPVDLSLRLGVKNVTLISDGMSDLQRTTPCDFAWRCRPLTEVERWKATAFRQILPCLGPVVPRGVLDLFASVGNVNNTQFAIPTSSKPTVVPVIFRSPAQTQEKLNAREAELANSGIYDVVLSATVRSVPSSCRRSQFLEWAGRTLQTPCVECYLFLSTMLRQF
ncbi:hypothetical protein EG68_12286, partial [Paragonimus skrjabini miyazakii]